VSEETTAVQVSYSPWELNPATGAMVSIVTRTDTGEVIGRAEQFPQEPEEQDPARASALAKLAALGLTEEEIGALLK
jgi:hypothetical protein